MTTHLLILTCITRLPRKKRRNEKKNYWYQTAATRRSQCKSFACYFQCHHVKASARMSGDAYALSKHDGHLIPVGMCTTSANVLDFHFSPYICSSFNYDPLTLNYSKSSQICIVLQDRAPFNPENFFFIPEIKPK